MKFKDDLQREIYYHSQIDYCYFVLGELSEQPQTIQSIKTCIEMVKCIVLQKPKLNIDNSKDIELLKEFKSLLKRTK